MNAVHLEKHANAAQSFLWLTRRGEIDFTHIQIECYIQIA